MKTLTNEHLIVFWGSKRVLRSVAEAAFNAEDMGHLLPSVDHYDALKRAVAEIVGAHNIEADGKVKVLPLSGRANSVGCEVRRYIRGATRNDLPFLFSFGAMQQADGSFAIEMLEHDGFQCPVVQKNKRAIERQATEHWESACLYLSANDLTNAITGLVRASHGFLLRDEGVVWYMPENMVGPYERIAAALGKEGVVMQTVRFSPVVNDGLIRHVSDELIRRSLAVFNGQVEEAEAMRQRGAKPRSNGQQTRLEEWIAAEQTLQHNKGLLGKAFAHVAKAARLAREKIGAAALEVFA